MPVRFLQRIYDDPSLQVVLYMNFCLLRIYEMP